MKKQLIYIFILICTIPLKSYAQPCMTDGDSYLYLTSQASIDEFGILYPNCTILNLNVRIDGDDITDLSSLSNITHVMGDLRISDCLNLQSLNGLNNLIHVEGHLNIRFNPILFDISSLNGLQVLREDFTLNNLPLLTAFGEFAVLDSILGEFTLTRLENIPENAFSALAFINELSIQNNNISTVSGFPSLDEVANALSIQNNPLLQQINGFSQLESIGSDLSIETNQMLEGLTGFDNLKSIGNKFELSEVPLLEEINQAFNELEIVEYIFLIESTGLEDLSGFQNLKTVGPTLIYSNPSLNNLDGLEQLVTINGELQIWNNEILNDLTAITEIDYSNIALRYNDSPINGSYLLFIMHNPMLDNCDIQIVCDILKRKQPNRIRISTNGSRCSQKEEVLIPQCKSHRCYTGGFSISSEEEIDSLFKDLPVCNYIDGDLIIGSNSIIADNKVLYLEDLSFIDTITGDIIIENTLLKEVVGLSGVHYVGGKLRIVNNPNLEYVAILPNVNRYQELSIENNPKLEEIASFRISNMHGNISIKDNPILEELRMAFTSLLEGDITIENNALLEFILENQVEEYYVDGNVKIQNIKFTRALGMKRISGNIILENIESMPTYGVIAIDTILGNLTVQNNPNLEIFKIIGLTHVGGNLEFINNENLTLMTPSGSANDPNVRSIGGDLKIINSKFTDSAIKEEFEMIRSIGGNLIITNNAELEALTAFNSLMYNSTSGITITNNSSLNDCDLKTLCWQIANNPTDVEISGNNGNCANFELAETNCDLESCVGPLGAHLQKFIDRWLEINEICSIVPEYLNISDQTPTWDTLSLLGLSNITEVAGDVTFTGHALDSLTGLNNLRLISGDLEFENQGEEFDMSALSNLEYVGGILSLRNSKIKSFNGLDKLERVGSMNIALEDDLESLEGLESLKTIDHNLVLRFLDITSLKGLENLEYVGDEVDIQSLHKLNDVTALRKLEAEHLEECSFKYNNELTNCDLKLICDYIELHPDDPFVLFNNHIGCSYQELDCADFDINGIVYYDSNQNGLRDVNEYGVSNLSVLSEDQTKLTNSDGVYKIYQDIGDTYSIAFVDNPLWTLTSSNMEYSGQVDSNTYLNDFDFGISPNFSDHGVSANITSNNIRCSESGAYYIKVQNLGTYSESGEIQVKYDPSIEFVSSDIMPIEHDEISHTLIWFYDDLQPFETLDLSLEFLHPDFNMAGESLTSEVTVYHTVDQSQIELSYYRYETILGCSYDPNDKQVSPLGESSEAYILKDEPVTYTIRFQNTGNDYARNIRLVDTLSPLVNMSTFRIVNTSHEMYTNIRNREVTFNFDDIYLLDSLTNPELSQGFVSFEVQLNEDVPDYSLLENYADIYFDFNPPITTNTVINSIVENFPTSIKEVLHEKQFDIYPNPFNSIVNLIADQPGQVIIYDAAMRIVKRIEMQEVSTVIDMSNYSNGVYYVSYESIKGVKSYDIIVKN